MTNVSTKGVDMYRRIGSRCWYTHVHKALTIRKCRTSAFPTRIRFPMRRAAARLVPFYQRLHASEVPLKPSLCTRKDNMASRRKPRRAFSDPARIKDPRVYAHLKFRNDRRRTIPNNGERISTLSRCTRALPLLVIYRNDSPRARSFMQMIQT